VFYPYYQNNSGGRFIVNETVTTYVIIEALDANEANFRAESLGIYFNGCETGDDCPCCGNRWNPAYKTDGTAEPTIYERPIAKRFENLHGFIPTTWVNKGEPDVIVHYLDGHAEKHYPPDSAYV
jgi:hypothetical protein